VRIVHVEHDALDLDLARETLQSGGVPCEVIAVSSRAELMSVLAERKFDLILSDWSLPQFSGSEALEIAKEMAADIPFIFVSGTIGEDAAIESLLGGATDYVLKHRLNRLVPAVRRALDEARERGRRREAQEALNHERRFLKAVLESLEAGLVACNQAGIISLSNRSAREHFGVPDEPLPLERWQEFYQLYEADGKTPMRTEDLPLVRALRGEQVRNFEMVICPRNLPARTVLVSGQPIVDEEGRRRGAVVVFPDITDRKQLEEQLRQAQKMEALGQLAGGIAHDFNNLLNVIIGYSDLVRRQLMEADPMRDRIEQIRSAGHRAASLTRQLLAFSRKQVVAPKVLDLNGVLSDLHRMLERLLGESVELASSRKDGLGRIKADPGQIEQVIMNLAVNARDAMQSGGRITIETDNVILDTAKPEMPGGVEPGRYIMLAVHDSGIGMSPEVQARVFEPFFTTKEPGRGTGLGLATVYGIVKGAGGHIELQSALGRGTTFRIYFPRVDAPADAVIGRESRDFARGSETILVVEDEESVRHFVRDSLTHCGYSVLEAADGRQAEEIWRRAPEQIHLLLTDVVLPGVGGCELAVRLKDDRPSLKVLFMSGYTDERVTREISGEAGAPFLPKPFALPVLARKVREALDSTSPPAEPAPADVLPQPAGRRRKPQA
jgi:hypothetical protein